jgi:hypothetical protein
MLAVELPQLPFSWTSVPAIKSPDASITREDDLSEAGRSGSSAFSWAETLNSWIYRASSNIEAVELVGLTREV